ncbi:hypothetical protein AB0E08_07605 [Streptomyces sp. NPDC048281]|uniref:hypothetical protein n=1 Tax=Streptomyces sp. NPDC048281 TaxID=3154715 RepID=UPI00341D9EC7
MPEPACDSMEILHDAREIFCDRRPHRHGDHTTEGGDRWPSFEGEYDEMLTLTTADLRKLLASSADDPVLYVSRDEVTGEPVRLDVWAGGLVAHGDIVARRSALVDALGGASQLDGVTDGGLEGLLEGYQAAVDAIEEASAVPDDACVADGTVYPEHDFPPEGEGNECRRCGAEAASSEPDGVYDGEIR